MAKVSNVSAYGTEQRYCIREYFRLIVVTEGNEDEPEIPNTPLNMINQMSQILSQITPPRVTFYMTTDNHSGCPFWPVGQHFKQGPGQVFATDWAMCRSSPDTYHCVAEFGKADKLTWLLKQQAPYCHPNRLMIKLADQVLSLDGKLVDAVAYMGEPDENVRPQPFVLNVW